MGKPGKVISTIILLFIVVIAGLIAFVHYYLTEERVKALIIPQAESALGREVAIGSIKIGLLSGITIRDFLIREEDRKNTFVSTKAFVLSYELLPLLQKKIIISEIRFDEPTISIIRDKNGNFNFSTLAILSSEPPKTSTEQQKSASAALPLALTINQIRINKAQISIRDHLDEIPATDATANADLTVALGQTMEALRFNGSFDFDAAVSYESVQASLKGKGSISQKDMDIAVDTDLDGEKVHAEAEVKNFMQAPNAQIAVSSKSLNLDKLLGIVAGVPKSQGEKPPKTKSAQIQSGEVIADSLPTGLVARGSVKVDKAIYHGLTANDFLMSFDLAEGVLTVRELSAKAYGGRLDADMTVDLNQPGPAYDGKLGLESMQAADLSSDLIEKLSGMLTGTLQSAMTFSGAGTSWEQIRKVLTADGSFNLTNGGIKGTPVSMSIANLLNLQELNNINYKNISGTFTIVKGGKAKIKTNLQGTDLDAETEGTIGLDGSLDLPLTLHLSPALADKLKSRASFAKYLTDEQGTTALHLKLAGNLKSPQPTLDMKGVQEQLQKSLEKEILKKLDNSGQDSGQKTSPENMLKGLFNR
jgi:AsmA protein